MSANFTFYGSNSYYQTLKMLIDHVSDNIYGLRVYMETNGHKPRHTVEYFLRTDTSTLTNIIALSNESFPERRKFLTLSHH